jgi:hypothetical protein
MRLTKRRSFLCGLGFAASIFAANAQEPIDPAKYCAAKPTDPRCAGYLGSKLGPTTGGSNWGPTQYSQQKDPNARFLAFIHTGGGDPGVAAKLTESLKQRGLTVGGVDDKQDISGGAGVDYFTVEDGVTAANVADATNQLFPPGSSFLRARFQKIRNPVGFLGVWIYDPHGDQANWSAKKPAWAWCYQEQKTDDDPTKRFFVACHVERSNCEKARGPNNPTPGTNCFLVDLTMTSWNPNAGGLFGSLYQYSASAFPAPFPQI